jgi:hypothetical protein
MRVIFCLRSGGFFRQRFHSHLRHKGVRFSCFGVGSTVPMTLAAILFVSIFFAASAHPVEGYQSAAQPAATAPSGASQAQNPPSSSAPAPTAPTQTSAAGKPAAGKAVTHKKKASTSNCTPVPATATQSGASSADSSGTEHAASPDPPTNCPPTRKIVRQGGTSEPSIQLAGGAEGDKAAQQRNSADQMLASTEGNLKKIAGQALNSDQQDAVNQIRQFMDQSKSAEASGDLDRAHALARKAQLLSQELVKPPQ